MKKILFILLLTAFSFTYCSTPRKATLVSVKQGISGLVTESIGNQMPMKSRPPAQPKGIVTTVYFYEPTQLNQTLSNEPNTGYYTLIKTRLVASIDTDSTGAFAISLPAGKYSVFVKKGLYYYANLFDAQNNIALFTVEVDQLTKINLTVNSAATY
jgi:hypothetical protein